MTVSSSLNTWATQLVFGQQQTSDQLQFSVDAGESATVTIQMMVPENAEMNAKNTLTLRTTLQGGDMIVNATRFIVQEIAALDASADSTIPLSLGQTGTTDIWVRNAGRTSRYHLLGALELYPKIGSVVFNH